MIQVTVTDALIGVPLDIHWRTDSTGAAPPATAGLDYTAVTTIFTLTASSSTEVFNLLVPVVRDARCRARRKVLRGDRQRRASAP